MSIAAVDISTLDESTADKVVEAAKSLGFVHVYNHGIPASQLDRIWSISKEYFSKPLIDKCGAKGEYIINESNVGYSPPNSEKLDSNDPEADDKESINVHPDSLPPSLHPYHSEIAHFQSECQRVSRRILDLLSLALQSDISAKHTGKSGTMLRFLHYPPSSAHIRAGAHTDYGSITLLFQPPNQLGLEVMDQTWKNVESQEGMICVNIADQLEIWTGVLKSTLHRVTGYGERYSIAYFVHPDDETELCVDGKVITARQHLEQRLSASYVR